MGEMNDIDRRDSERNKVLDTMFQTSKKPSGVNLQKIKTELENDLFEVLKKHGFEKNKVMPAVANLIYNLSRL